MKICRNCGTRLSDQAVFCHICGRSQRIGGERGVTNQKPIIHKAIFYILIIGLALMGLAVVGLAVRGPTVVTETQTNYITQMQLTTYTASFTATSTETVTMPLSVNLCKGSWNGTAGPGTGTIFSPGETDQITTNSIVTGTFAGGTTPGNLMGTAITNYSVPGFTNGQVLSAITGSYVMSVAANAIVTGSATIPLTGQLTGQMQITFQGKESQSGELTGTWTGTLTVTRIIFQSTPYDASITAPASGQFTFPSSTACG